METNLNIMSIIGIEKALGNVYFFRMFDESYVFGSKTLNVYKISNSSTELVNRIASFKKDAIPTTSLIDYFQHYPELVRIMNMETESSPTILRSEEAIPILPSFTETTSLRELTLVITNSCNMACKYCYLSESLQENCHMDIETAIIAVDYLFLHSTDKIYISYFGGEPLLNYDVLKACTEYASNKASSECRTVDFELVTNGTIVSDDIIDFLTEHGFKVGISLDGPKEIHNSNRVFASGKGTYDTVYSNLTTHFAQLAKVNEIRLLIALHHEFYDRVTELYDFFRELDYKTGISFNMFGKINYIGNRDGIGDTINYIDDYYEMQCKYVYKVFEECLDLDSVSPIFDRVRIDGQFLRLLQDKKPQEKNLCSSGVEMFMVYPDGSIAGCRQLDPTIYPNAIWTNINDLQSVDEKARLEPSQMCGVANQACGGCFIRNACKGSCPAMNYHYGQFDKPDKYSCGMLKTAFKLSVWLRDKLIKSDIWNRNIQM
jgi:uncharacterized protein